MITLLRISTSSVVCMLLVMTGAGCGKAYPTVMGKVTLDGQPLIEARLRFTSIDGEGPTGFATTNAEGEYSLELDPMRQDPESAEVAPGAYEVWITTYQPGIPEIEPPVPAVKERVPAKYNYKTELRKNVTVGKNVIDFELDSQGEIIEPREEASDF